MRMEGERERALTLEDDRTQILRVCVLRETECPALLLLVEEMYMPRLERERHVIQHVLS